MQKQTLLTLLLLLPPALQAQWEIESRLTNASAPSLTSYNNAWCIAAAGSTLHITWFDARDGNTEIYYKHSSDGGTSWDSDIRLTNNASDSKFPAIAVSGQTVHIVWQDFRDGNTELYYKRSTDGGASWNTDTRLTNNTGNSEISSIAAEGSSVHIVWNDHRDGNYEVYYKLSTDGGASWGADTRLTNAANNSWFPSIAISGQTVHLVWRDQRDGNSEIYYKLSTNGGISWGTDTRLTNESLPSTYPCVSASGQTLYTVWQDTRDGNPEIYYKRSTDGGANWEADTRLTNNTTESEFPNVSVTAGAVHVSWVNYRAGIPEINYKFTTDGGANWSLNERISSAESYYPSLCVSGTAVYAVWSDERHGSSEIYYTRNPNGNPVGIVTLSNEVPSGFALSQNYPNPFNPITNFEFSMGHESPVKLVVYNSLGKEAAVLVNQNLKAGVYKYSWDASNFNSGVYFYRLTAEGFSETKKMLLVK